MIIATYQMNTVFVMRSVASGKIAVQMLDCFALSVS